MLSFIITEDTFEHFISSMECYPPIVIIEPAQLDTSESTDPDVRVIDFRAERMAAQMGLHRVNGAESWTRPYGGGTLVGTLHGWMRNARTRTAIKVGARATHEPTGYSTPYGRHI